MGTVVFPEFGELDRYGVRAENGVSSRGGSRARLWEGGAKLFIT